MASPQIEDGTVRIATELFEAECRVKMSGSEWQVYRFVQRKTYGWKKPRDAIGYGQFVTGTGLDRRRVIEAVKSLENRRMLVVTRNGLYKPNVYEIQKNYSKWLVVTKSALVTKNGSSSDKKRLGVVTKSAPTIATNSIANTKAKTLLVKSTFDQFWDAYPKKVKKKDSLKVWKAKRLVDIADQITADVNSRKVSDRRWREGYIPDPTTYLRGERWTDAIDRSTDGNRPIGSRRNERLRREFESTGNKSTGDDRRNVPAGANSEKIRRLG